MATNGAEPYGGTVSRAPDPAVSLAVLIVRTGRAIAQVRDAALAPHGLTSTSLGALGELARSGGASHRELAARLGVAPATLTPVVALDRTGDLVRDRDPLDRRVVRLWITAPGRRRFAAASATVDGVLRARMPVPAEETVVRAHLLAVLAAFEPGS